MPGISLEYSEASRLSAGGHTALLLLPLGVQVFTKEGLSLL